MANFVVTQTCKIDTVITHRLIFFKFGIAGFSFTQFVQLDLRRAQLDVLLFNLIVQGFDALTMLFSFKKRGVTALALLIELLDLEDGVGIISFNEELL